MKTRTRTLTIPSEERLRPFLRVGTPSTPIGELPIISGSHETLKEVYTPNSELGVARRRWKSFSHYKKWDEDESDRDCHSAQVRYWHGDVNQYIVVTGSRPSDLQPFDGFAEWGSGPLGGLVPFLNEESLELDDGEFIPPPAQLDDLERMALKTMSPKIRAQLSLLNSLYELKDFRTLRKSLTGLQELVKRLNLKALGSKTLAQILRVSADSYLQLMFNFRPLLSDIAGFHRAMTKTLARFKSQADFEGRPQVAHFSYKWNEEPETLTESTIVGTGSPTRLLKLKYWNTSEHYDPALLTRKVTTSAAIFHAQMQYVVRHPVSLPPELARGLALLDGLGVNLNPAIVWNAIPWSFVVDWFVRVGDYLDGFKVGFMDPQVQVLQYLWSIKRERKVEFSISYPTWNEVGGSVPYAPNGEGYSRVRVTNETAYRRFVGIPDPSLFSTSGLSLTELSLGVALGVSKILGRKRSARRNPTNWHKVLKKNLRGMRIRRSRKR